MPFILFFNSKRCAPKLPLIEGLIDEIGKKEMPTIAEAAKSILEREGQTYIWFGQMDLWHEAYELARGKTLHPMDTWQAVRSALSRSKLFRVQKHIRCASWSGREILHPCFDLVVSKPE